MALAIRLDQLIRDGVVTDQAELARLGHVTRARLTQIMNLLNLADLFIASLLQDMAIPVLAKELPEHYEALLGGQHSGRARLSDLENERFGWNHATAAGMMARGWGLSEELAELIEMHTDIDALLAAQHDFGKQLVGLSALLPSASSPEWTERQRFEELFHTIGSEQWPALATILEQIDNEFQEFAPVLNLAVPRRSLVESFRLSAEEAPNSLPA
ncbi:MAG: HDOD domain-containing protein [Pirellulaceae bacterium]